VSEKSEWKFPDGVKLASGGDIGIVISVGGPRDFSESSRRGKLVGTLNFVCPLDTLSLVSPSGKVECEETVFSDFPDDF